MTQPERRPAPEPIATDEVRVVAVGTALFAIGLVLTLIFHDRLEDDGRGDWVWIMACRRVARPDRPPDRPPTPGRPAAQTATDDPSTGEPGPNLP